MSTLSVDTIQGQTTAAKVKMPAGSILQYKSGNSNSNSVSTTSTSLVATGAYIDFTPFYNNSIVMVTVQSRRFNLVTSDTINFELRRGGSTVVGKSGHSKDIHFQNNNSSSSNQIAYPLSYMFEDTPATTSQVRYEIYMKVNGGDGYLADSGGVQFYVMEIAQ